MTDLLPYEDEIRSVEGPGAGSPDGISPDPALKPALGLEKPRSLAALALGSPAYIAGASTSVV